MQILYFVSLLVIFSVSVWAVFSKKVSDDLCIKSIIMLLALSVLAKAANYVYHGFGASNSTALFTAAVACFALRCAWIKCLKRKYRRWCRKCKH